MKNTAVIADILAFQPMPKLAAALRRSKNKIVTRWDALVRQLLPDADQLTSAEVRDSIPSILEQMAKAIEADNPAPTEKLAEVSKTHGAERFHEHYNIRELMVEYRLLRRILAEEIDAVFAGQLSVSEWVALDTAVDIAMQQAVSAFIEHHKTQLKASTESEAKYLAFLAHDMRGSLNNVMLSMQWMEHSLRSDPKYKAMTDILKAARSSAAETIISMERLLQAEQMRKNPVPRKVTTVQLHTLVSDVVAQSKAVADAKGLSFSICVDGEAVTETDAGLLKVILLNLIGNAIKYSDSGTITIEAIPCNDSQHFSLRVSDQGCGISPELLPYVFNPFEREEAYGHSGAGLGLFIAAKAAETLGASLSVESVVGTGSTFTVQLPLNTRA